jgi:vacuolar protein sorting-associated protein 13A/C
MEKLGSKENDHSLHFIERVNMAFSVEMCILPKETSFTWLKVTGNLPRLHLNLSDRKYKAFMKTLSFISYSISTPVVDLVAERISVVTSNDWIDSYPSPDLGTDEFFDAEEDIESNQDDMPISNPLLTVVASDQDLIKMSHTVIEFVFQVGEVSVSLQKTDPSNSFEESTLAELNIYDFGLKYVSRPFDYKAIIHIASAQIKDNMQQSEQFQYLMFKAARADGEGEREKFITIVYDSINRTSPEFKGIDQAADVKFGGKLL